MASTELGGKAKRPRPLSPHLDIYAWSVTMAISIGHRVTGVGLYFGVLLFAWFLLALSTDAANYAIFSAFIHSIIGQLVLFGFTWSLFQHLMTGLRHFLMDEGIGLDPPLRDPLGWATLVASVGLTLVTWIAAYLMR